MTQGTALTPGTCMIHGYHGRAVCPSCSTSSVPAAQITPGFPANPPSQNPVDPIAQNTAALHRLANSIDALAAALARLGGNTDTREKGGQ